MFTRIHAIVLVVAALMPAVGYTVPKVVSTINPIHFLVMAVGTGVIDPVLPSTGASCVHDCVLKPSDVAKLNAADVLFYIDEGLEPFIKKIKEHTKGRLVRLSDEVSLLPVRSTHNTKHKTGHTHHILDFHIWLSPSNAEKIIQKICRTLSDADPKNATAYQRNTAVALGKIQEMSKNIADMLEPVKNVPYVVVHDAYQYFDSYFGLNFITTFSSGHTVENTTAQGLHMAKNASRTHVAKCIFSDIPVANIGNSLVEKEVRMYVVDPLGKTINTSENGYFELMSLLAEKFRECLSL